MNRADLQVLAEERADDATALLNAGRWSGAYYLAGYAIECALKACIAKLTNLEDYPDKQFAIDCYTHNIEKLVNLAGLKLNRDADVQADKPLGSNWLLVNRWKEEARYKSWTESEARKLVSAVTDTANGVLPWIRTHW